MSRTTINLDEPILQKIKWISQHEEKSMTRVVSELLLLGIDAKSKKETSPTSDFHWHGQKMDALLDLNDGESLYAVVDRDYGH
jgi:hypothetical protein